MKGANRAIATKPAIANRFLLLEADPVELDAVAPDLVTTDAEATIALRLDVGTAEVFFMSPLYARSATRSPMMPEGLNTNTTINTIKANTS